MQSNPCIEQKESTSILFAVSPYLVGRIQTSNIQSDGEWIQFDATPAAWNTPEDRWARTEPFCKLPISSILELTDLDTGEVHYDVADRLATHPDRSHPLPSGTFARELQTAGLLEAAQLLRYFARKVRPENRKRDLAPILKLVTTHAPHLSSMNLEQSLASLAPGNEQTFVQRVRDIRCLPIRDDCIKAAAAILLGTGRRPVAREMADYFARTFNTAPQADPI